MIRKDDKQALERYKDKLRRAAEYSHVNFGESEEEKRKRIARAKKEFKFCVQYYFPHYAMHESADFHQECADFLIKHRDCIDAEVWFRGSAKSVTINIFVLFWLWINDELDVTLLVGKTFDDAKILLSDLQAEFEGNPQIIADFGEQKQLGSWEDGSFVTKNDRAFFALGLNQSPRGIRHRNKRPNCVVIDDSDDDTIALNQRRVKKAIRWLFGALYGAGDVKGLRMIFANNLISNTGIIAHVIEKIKGLKQKNARVNMIPALDKKGNPTWPQKYTRQFFLDKQRIMGDYAFQTEYQNNPQIEGKIFLDNQIQWVPLPPLNKFEAIVGHWDVAYSGTETGDYNSVKVWGLYEGKFYHIKAFARQCKMAEAIEWMIDFEAGLPKDVKVQWRFESQFWNDPLKMALRQACEKRKRELLLIQCDRPLRNKFDRIISMQPYYQNSRILYNIKEKYDLDMQVGINQLKSIEPGYTTHDDAPDADEGAISYLNKFMPMNNPLPIVGKRKHAAGAW